MSFTPTPRPRSWFWGGENDLGFAQEVVDGLECPILNLVGKLSLRQTAAQMTDCKVFI